MRKKIKSYVISIAAALAVGGLSALFTRANMPVYETLNRPYAAPPAILFPIVWSVLFILMGIGSAAVWETRKSNYGNAVEALKIYAFQLAVNFFGTIIFFNMQSFLFAFVWLVLLWILIVVMIVKFKRVSSVAAYIQIPYLLWVSFAGYLTFMIFLLNQT